MSLERSRALWNRDVFDLASDEILAQILDRGDLDDWRELYRLAKGDPTLRQRIHALLRRVPVGLPHFWLAALDSLGEPVDYAASPPEDIGI